MNNKFIQIDNKLVNVDNIGYVEKKEKNKQCILRYKLRTISLTPFEKKFSVGQEIIATYNDFEKCKRDFSRIAEL